MTSGGTARSEKRFKESLWGRFRGSQEVRWSLRNATKGLSGSHGRSRGSQGCSNSFRGSQEVPWGFRDVSRGVNGFQWRFRELQGSRNPFGIPLNGL